MQITADLFLDIIFLLINNNCEQFQVLANEILGLYADEAAVAEGSDAGLIRFYIRLIKEIILGGADRDDPDALLSTLLKFKSDKDILNHREVLDDLKDIFKTRKVTEPEAVVKLTSRLEGIAKKLKTVIMWHRTNKATRKVFARLQNCSGLDPVVQAQELESIQSELTKMNDTFAQQAARDTGPQPLDSVDFHDRDSVKSGLKKFEKRNVQGVLRMGLQGLNRALGSAGGFVQGESVTFNALPHMYKSGILISCAMWAVEYNPQITTEEGEPMIIFFSLENEAFQNMYEVFKQKYFLVEGKHPTGLSNEEIEEWLINFFAKFNVRFRIERFIPQDFGYKEFVQRINYFKSQGYRIIMAVVDYANLMKKTMEDSNASRGGQHLAVKELFSRMCNFTKSEGITWLTAHPLNRKAQELANVNINAVKRFNLDHLAESVDVEREVDVSIYMHREVNTITGVVYLTFNIMKHRYVNDTPESHKYFAYAFREKGVGILDDIGQKPAFTTDIYATDFDDASAFQAGATDDAQVSHGGAMVDPGTAVF